jgi:hypothetical protein
MEGIKTLIKSKNFSTKEIVEIIKFININLKSNYFNPQVCDFCDNITNANYIEIYNNQEAINFIYGNYIDTHTYDEDGNRWIKKDDLTIRNEELSVEVDDVYILSDEYNTKTTAMICDCCHDSLSYEEKIIKNKEAQERLKIEIRSPDIEEVKDLIKTKHFSENFSKKEMVELVKFCNFQNGFYLDIDICENCGKIDNNIDIDENNGKNLCTDCYKII